MLDLLAFAGRPGAHIAVLYTSLGHPFNASRTFASGPDGAGTGLALAESRLSSSNCFAASIASSVLV